MGKLKTGFYTALGTPLDEQGNIIEDSLTKHIESQIQAGASGLLLLGTMGRLGSVKLDQYEITVKIAEKAVAGRVRLMVGAADNSVAQVKWRMDILNKYNVNPVLTAPYYKKTRPEIIENYFSKAAQLTDHDVVLYDHPPTARVSLSYANVLALSRIKNIIGIKTANLILAKTLFDSEEIKEDFTPVFSNSDLFTVGYTYGIEHYLDGIFSCFPQTIRRAQEFFAKNEFKNAGKVLDDLMRARDYMLAVGISPAFTYAMNILGFAGNFGPDFELELDDQSKNKMKEILSELGEI